MNGERLEDVSYVGGFAHLQKGHGISFADFDQDGDQDIYAVMGGAYEGDRFFNAFFNNPGFGSHSIKIRLRGHQTNSFQESQNQQTITSSMIRDQAGQSLADMTENIAGVRTIRNGSGITKPVIHGLYGNRVA